MEEASTPLHMSEQGIRWCYLYSYHTSLQDKQPSSTFRRPRSPPPHLQDSWKFYISKQDPKGIGEYKYERVKQD